MSKKGDHRMKEKRENKRALETTEELERRERVNESLEEILRSASRDRSVRNQIARRAAAGTESARCIP